MYEVIIIMVILMSFALCVILSLFYILTRTTLTSQIIVRGNDFMSNLTVIVSPIRSVVIYDKRIIFQSNKETDNGLTFLIFSPINDVNMTLTSQVTYDLMSGIDVQKMDRLVNGIGNSDIVIVVSKGDVFNLFADRNNVIGQQGIGIINQLGGKTSVFRRDDNYLLILSKGKDIHYERISPNVIYYPYISIVKSYCKRNPGNVKYPINYTIFDDHSFDTDKIMKCALESTIHKTNKFGIIGDVCMPMNEIEFLQYNNMPDSDKCVFGIGRQSDNAVGGYIISNGRNVESLQGVSFYQNNNVLFTLNEGIYQSNDINNEHINSINVPENFYVFLVKYDMFTGMSDIVPYYGPIKEDVKLFDGVDFVIIQRHEIGNAVVCGENNGKKVCMTFPKGKHILHPKLYLKVTSVTLSRDIRKLGVYSDSNGHDLIETVENTFANPIQSAYLFNIKFPQITRCIIVS